MPSSLSNTSQPSLETPSSAPGSYRGPDGLKQITTEIKKHHAGLAFEYMKSRYGDSWDTQMTCARPAVPTDVKLDTEGEDRRGRIYTRFVLTSHFTFVRGAPLKDIPETYKTTWVWDHVSPPQCTEHPDRPSAAAVNPEVDSATRRRGSDAKQSLVDKRWDQWSAGAFP